MGGIMIADDYKPIINKLFAYRGLVNEKLNSLEDYDSVFNTMGMSVEAPLRQTLETLEALLDVHIDMQKSILQIETALNMVGLVLDND